MTVSNKISFSYRRAARIQDLADIVEMLFPGNRNQQHAAARILLELKQAGGLVPSLGLLQEQHSISRRTLQRTRAKLAKLGLIEHVSWMNRRYGGQTGWKLSSRMGTALWRFADRLDAWRKDKRPDRMEKEGVLVELLR